MSIVYRIENRSCTCMAFNRAHGASSSPGARQLLYFSIERPPDRLRTFLLGATCAVQPPASRCRFCCRSLRGTRPKPKDILIDADAVMQACRHRRQHVQVQWTLSGCRGHDNLQCRSQSIGRPGVEDAAGVRHAAIAFRVVERRLQHAQMMLCAPQC
jgi:hypothetical protein